MAHLAGLEIYRPHVTFEAYLATGLARFGTGMHFHEEYQVVVMDAGERDMQFRHGHVRLRGGECLIIPPGVAHSGTSLRDEQSTFRTVYFRGGAAGVSAREKQCLPTGAVVVRDPMIVGAAGLLCDRIVAGRLSGPQDIPPPLMAEICRIAAAQEKRVASKFLMEVLDEITADADSRPTVTDIARRVAVSRYHLIRAFSDAFGLSPCAYGLRHRLNRAKGLLADGNPASAVALDLGFYDQSHFGTHFKNVTGLSPREYQRKVAKTGPAHAAA